MFGTRTTIITRDEVESWVTFTESKLRPVAFGDGNGYAFWLWGESDEAVSFGVATAAAIADGDDWLAAFDDESPERNLVNVVESYIEADFDSIAAITGDGFRLLIARDSAMLGGHDDGGPTVASHDWFEKAVPIAVNGDIVMPRVISDEPVTTADVVNLVISLIGDGDWIHALWQNGRKGVITMTPNGDTSESAPFVVAGAMKATGVDVGQLMTDPELIDVALNNDTAEKTVRLLNEWFNFVGNIAVYPLVYSASINEVILILTYGVDVDEVGAALEMIATSAATANSSEPAEA